MAAPSEALKRGQRSAASLAFLTAALGWTLISSGTSGGSPAGTVAVLAASGASLITAALVGRRTRWIVPAVIVAAACVLAIVSGGDVLSSRPTRGPFSYSNATGAFYVQAAAASLMLLATGPRGWVRWAGGVAMLGFAGIAVASGSLAASLLLILPLAGAVATRLGRGREALVAMVCLFAVVLISTASAGATHGEETPRRAREGMREDRRQILWHEATMLMEDNPLTGVGPGRFAAVSPVARSDSDARWAHHGFLQFGAETGFAGFGLLTLAFAFALAALAGARRPDAVTVLGAAALVAFGAGACLDYLMHFPALPVTAAALTGTAMSKTDV